MLRMLLDIAYPGRPYVRHPRVLKPVEPETVVDSTATTPDGATDTINNTVGDSLAQVQGIMSDVGNNASDDSTMLLYASLFVVFFALAVCLYFVFNYRRSLATK